MALDKAVIDLFAELAATVTQNVLQYATLSNADRDEESEGQLRRLRGINSGMGGALGAVLPWQQPFIPPGIPDMRAAPMPPPAAAPVTATSPAPQPMQSPIPPRQPTPARR